MCVCGERERAGAGRWGTQGLTTGDVPMDGAGPGVGGGLDKGWADATTKGEKETLSHNKRGVFFHLDIDCSS